MHLATDDNDLLRQLRAGDAASFQALYQRHQGALYRFALLRSGSAATAADVVQDTFIALLTGSLAFDPLRGALRNFLFGVVRKLVLKHDAPDWRIDSLPEPDEDGNGALELGSVEGEPLAQLLSSEAVDEVRRAIALLPPHFRDPLILYEMHELSYLDIAAICQIDLGTVRSRLSRARAALAKRLRAHAPVSPTVKEHHDVLR